MMLKLLVPLLIAGTLTLVGFSYNQNEQSQIQSNLETAQSTSPQESNNPNQLLSHMDLNLLESFVNAEGENESQITKSAIAAVVMNRLKNNNFPKSVSGIIFQPGHFTSVDNGNIWKISSDDSAKHAVQNAINGFDPTEGCLYYYNPEVSTIPATYTPVKQIGKYIFCNFNN
ncbi:spore germination cell wall hydrolase CwlJ-like protein [Paenibacillus sp. V4I3]|uniref:cell wall hydrolase n=1 Tax=Paenibacillus sp. V4I3 TaxID=3042305 RepID=UPI0027857F80|nr:cell wall hydrolase [Paenibacillus sp. V4I3]MDQ0878859.1 spore germination cell wall hydrolase CwlJ-like protein [Paenibacillus sp. V4I3]